jgi:single-strand DNA-binding protein
VNNVSLIGALVQDPELTVERNGRQACFMRIEVPRRAGNGTLHPGVIYVDVTAFGQQAETCATGLVAGDRIGVSGTLERDDSLDSRGPRRSRWEVHAHQVDLLGPPATARAEGSA